MTQKIIKVGSSAAVTISKKSLGELNLRIGDRVTVDVDKKRKAVIIKPAVHIDKEIMNWTDKFIKKYRPALEALAK